MIPEIDWTAFGKVSTTCSCQCGFSYRSHAKAVKIGDTWKCISQIPCPQCGSQDKVRRASSDPEEFIIRSGDGK